MLHAPILRIPKTNMEKKITTYHLHQMSSDTLPNREQSYSPVGDLSVSGHEPCVDIGLFTQTLPGLHPNLLPEVQERVYKRCRNTREAQTIAQGKRGRQEKRRVCLVLLTVEREVWIEDGGDVVWCASIVIGDSARNRQVACVEGIREIEQRRDEPGNTIGQRFLLWHFLRNIYQKKNTNPAKTLAMGHHHVDQPHSTRTISNVVHTFSPPWRCKGWSDVRNLCPAIGVIRTEHSHKNISLCLLKCYDTVRKMVRCII